MIVIINTGKNPSPTGIHEYEIRINRQLITTFTHARETGLANCLRNAARAVEGFDRMQSLLKKEGA